MLRVIGSNLHGAGRPILSFVAIRMALRTKPNYINWLCVVFVMRMKISSFWTAPAFCACGWLCNAPIPNSVSQNYVSRSGFWFFISPFFPSPSQCGLSRISRLISLVPFLNLGVRLEAHSVVLPVVFCILLSDLLHFQLVAILTSVVYAAVKLSGVTCHAADFACFCHGQMILPITVFCKIFR
jgi:hypothetical protein